MSRITDYLDRMLYPDYSSRWDDDIFREKLKERIDPSLRCLDYGAGRGRVAEMNFSDLAGSVCGVDPDPEVLSNPFLGDAKVMSVEDGIIPYPDEYFDLVFSDNVMEHITNPQQVLCEIGRVLKPGGVLMFKTPNKSHYMPLIARSTPNWFHQYYNGLRERKSTDTFPTIYALNTKKSVLKEAGTAKLRVNSIQRIEGRPEYLRISGVTYLVGFLYERLVNSSSFFEPFRCVLIVELQKIEQE